MVEPKRGGLTEMTDFSIDYKTCEQKIRPELHLLKVIVICLFVRKGKLIG